ncbi:branched-chain alpha-keto acid dehydrogenase subunit E2 [Jannaschia pagri]|uniref:Endolytic murein transglycosylase n=1 Tax=Jannaschia pagri TaxID=2829797 RepID=A0ABQ4NMK4_9RHOB|nr:MULTISPECIES: endolytic transglycosylase MltG [unclassified Jannaschia]GIT91808.1 branched-chain alpha-keto acid dehydrogenase subunit E2 [Jannaschia sp. AI_61]GIT95642.1 branched-chain alpha-keto acid dehydrogenase subunit E2 [Jannaschia sp. AI_62]
MWKHIAANALTLGIVVIVCLAGLVQLGKSRWAEPGPLAEAAFFEVPRGANLDRVSVALARDGIVSSDSIFRIGTKYAERDRDLKFGTYEIPAGASMPEVLDIITAGGPSVFPYTVTYLLRARGPEVRVRERVPGQDAPVEVATFAPGVDATPEAYTDLVARGVPITWRVSVAPGLTSWEVVEGLKGADFLEGVDGLVVPPEGSLAPDTYDVARGSDAGDLLQRMRVAQERILAEAWAARVPGLPLETPQEALTLASIIEKETGVAEERRLVSAVFVNRLNQGMRLQTDPTVIYGITNGQGGLGRGLRRSELDRTTPYNTYRIDGLPPGPIANPSAAAIRAAMDPEETDFIFFVADGTGGHAFAETLAEHNRNVAAWRAIEAARQSTSGN